MGIDDSHRLQAGVDDGGPHELHAPVLQVLGNAIRQLRADHACLIDHLPFRPVPEATVKAPHSRWMARKIPALFTAARIFGLSRTMPESFCN